MAIIDIKESIREIKDLVWGLLVVAAVIGTVFVIPEDLILPLFVLAAAAIAGIVYYRVRLDGVIRKLSNHGSDDMVIPASLLSPPEQRLLRLDRTLPHASHVSLIRERLLLLKYFLKPLMLAAFILGFAVAVVYFA